ncbi:MAG TPA: hypothetical protein VNO70_24980 [Blastocatellia bacterium]|nr:hypothetical protein [Blastocatellia bacterium]
MLEKTGTSQNLIVTHAVLTGLTPLIPIPLLDDLVKSYFQRRLTRKLAETRGQPLSEQDVKMLADDRGGCLLGCFGTVLIYPVKKIFRKIFFILEWKRAIDTASRAYYHGYLMEYAFAQQWCAPAGPRSPAEVRAAIDLVLSQVNTSPVERAVGGVFRQSKSALKGAVNLLQRSLRRITGKPSENEVALAVESVEQEEERQVEGVVSRLQKAIESIPAEHFENLRAQFRIALGLQDSGESHKRDI